MPDRKPRTTSPPSIKERVRRLGVSLVQAAILRFRSGFRPPSDPWSRTLLKSSAKASMQRFNFTRS